MYAIALICMSMLAASVYLVMNDHPWWAAVILVMMAFIRYKEE